MKQIISYILPIISFFPQHICAQSIEQLFDLADSQSTQIVISQSGLEAASEALSDARAALLPDLTLSVSGSYIGNATLMKRNFSTSGTTDVIVAGFGPQPVENGSQKTPHWGNSFCARATQVIYAGGAIRSGIRMAELSEELARLDTERQRQEVHFLIVGFYLDLCNLHNQLQVIDQNISLTEAVIKNMEVRHKQGTVLKNDLTRYELQLMSLRLTREKISDAANIINHRLSTTLHLPEDNKVSIDSLSISNLLSHLPNLNVENYQQTASESNLTIRMASVGQQLSEQKIKSSRSSLLPSVALVVEDNLSGPYTTDLIPVDANVNVWYIGLGVKFDLGNHWKSKHNLRQAKVEHRQSTQKTALARENIENTVHADFVNYQTAFKEVQTQEKQVELAEQNYSIVENRYRSDMALLTDMLDASNMKLSADMSLADARIQLLYCYYKLLYTTGAL